MSGMGLVVWQELGGRSVEEQRVLDFLYDVGDAVIESARCERRLDEAWAECQRITAKLEPVSGGGCGDPHRDSAWAAYAELKDALREAYTRAKRLELRAERLLQKLPSGMARAILYLRYIKGLKWPDVQKSMQEIGVFYEERNLYNIRDKALTTAAELWSEEDMTL